LNTTIGTELEVMNNEYVLLTEKEEMWAKMLMQVLEDNDVPCTAFPVYGAGFSLKTGTQDRLKVYVPSVNLPLATELIEELFSEKSIQEEE
jgi:hypothetical protein